MAKSPVNIFKRIILFKHACILLHIHLAFNEIMICSLDFDGVDGRPVRFGRHQRIWRNGRGM